MAHGLVKSSTELGEYFNSSCEWAILFVGMMVVVSCYSEECSAKVVPTVVTEVVCDWLVESGCCRFTFLFVLCLDRLCCGLYGRTGQPVGPSGWCFSTSLLSTIML